jgi:hypothetical protein
MNPVDDLTSTIPTGKTDSGWLNTKVLRHYGHGRASPSAGCLGAFMTTGPVEYKPKFESKFIG